MSLTRRFFQPMILTVCLAGNAARADIPPSFDPAEYTQPKICPLPFVFGDGACKAPVAAEVQGLNADACKAAGLVFTAAKDGVASNCAMKDPKAAAPMPACKAISGFNAKLSADKCSYERALPSSASGDYIGDCFHVKGVPPGTDLQADGMYFVSGQKNSENDDRELTLIDGKRNFVRGCQALGGTQHFVSAAKLIEAGASRYGFAYGFLTMPYKYFPSDRSFLASVPVGGYAGWRYGQAGSGSTLAFAFTVGTVTANTVDPTKLGTDGKPTVTGTADVTALSAAAGVMFDVLKSPRGKPFKIGLFVGRDRVSATPTVDYTHNGKTWVAFQIGFDFTDN